MDSVDVLASALPPELKTLDLHKVLLPLPQRFTAIAPGNEEKLLAHFADTLKTLKAQQRSNTEYLSYVKQRITKLHTSPSPAVKVTPNTREGVLRFIAIYSRVKALKSSIFSYRLNASKSRKHALKGLIALNTYLLEHPYPVIFNLDRAIPNIDSGTFVTNPVLYKEYRVMKLALFEAQSYANHVPHIYNNSFILKQYLSTAVDAAIDKMKGSSEYFPPIEQEGPLYYFFSELLAPIDSELPKHWLIKRTNKLYSATGIVSDLRKRIISIFLLRYMFDRQYEAFWADPTPVVLTKAASYANKKCSDLEFNFNSEVSELPVASLFAHSKETMTPSNWFLGCSLEPCPVDIAYSMYKAYETLCIMGTVVSGEDYDQFTTNRDHGDIICLLRALVAVSPSLSPVKMIDIVTEWSDVLGFPSIFNTAISAFQKAISSLK